MQFGMTKSLDVHHGPRCPQIQQLGPRMSDELGHSFGNAPDVRKSLTHLQHCRQVSFYWSPYAEWALYKQSVLDLEAVGQH